MCLNPLCLIVAGLFGLWSLVCSHSLVVKELGYVHLSSYELDVLIKVLHGADHVIAHLTEVTIMAEWPVQKIVHQIGWTSSVCREIFPESSEKILVWMLLLA